MNTPIAIYSLGAEKVTKLRLDGKSNYYNLVQIKKSPEFMLVDDMGKKVVVDKRSRKLINVRNRSSAFNIQLVDPDTYIIVYKNRCVTYNPKINDFVIKKIDEGCDLEDENDLFQIVFLDQIKGENKFNNKGPSFTSADGQNRYNKYRRPNGVNQNRRYNDFKNDDCDYCNNDGQTTREMNSSNPHSKAGKNGTNGKNLEPKNSKSKNDDCDYCSNDGQTTREMNSSSPNSKAGRNGRNYDSKKSGSKNDDCDYCNNDGQTTREMNSSNPGYNSGKAGRINDSKKLKLKNDECGYCNNDGQTTREMNSSNLSLKFDEAKGNNHWNQSLQTDNNYSEKNTNDSVINLECCEKKKEIKDSDEDDIFDDGYTMNKNGDLMLNNLNEETFDKNYGILKSPKSRCDESDILCNTNEFKQKLINIEQKLPLALFG